MSLDDQDNAPTPDDGGPARTQTENKITIKVTSNGSIDTASYTATEGWDCAVVPAPGSTFTGSVQVKYGIHLLATWPVSTTTYYTIPAPPVPPTTLCVLTTGVATASNGTISMRWQC